MKTAKPTVSPKIEALDPGVEPAAWTLTSGKRLEEFAEQGGYLAPLLLMTHGFTPQDLETNRAPGLADWTKKKPD